MHIRALVFPASVPLGFLATSSGRKGRAAGGCGTGGPSRVLCALWLVCRQEVLAGPQGKTLMLITRGSELKQGIVNSNWFNSNYNEQLIH